MARKATAVWNGMLRDGTGTISTESGVLSKAKEFIRHALRKRQGNEP